MTPFVFSGAFIVEAPINRCRSSTLCLKIRLGVELQCRPNVTVSSAVTCSDRIRISRYNAEIGVPKVVKPRFFR